MSVVPMAMVIILACRVWWPRGRSGSGSRRRSWYLLIGLGDEEDVNPPAGAYPLGLFP